METEGWVPIAEFSGSDSDLEANMLIARLEADDIPATRFPVQAPSTILVGIMAQPIVILVPKDRENDAEAVLADYRGDTPE